AGRHAFAAGDQAGRRVVNLVCRHATHLANPFVDQVEAVHVCLREATATGVDGQSTTELEGAVLGERCALPTSAKAVSLEREQDERREGVVDLGNVNVACLDVAA